MGEPPRLATVSVTSWICLCCPQLCHIRIDELLVATAAGGVHSARMRTAPSDVQLVAGRVRVCQCRRRSHAAAAPLTTADSSAVLFLQRLKTTSPLPCGAEDDGDDNCAHSVVHTTRESWLLRLIGPIVNDCIFYLFLLRVFWWFHIPSLTVIIMSSNVCLCPFTPSRTVLSVYPVSPFPNPTSIRTPVRFQTAETCVWVTKEETHMDRRVCVYNITIIGCLIFYC